MEALILQIGIKILLLFIPFKKYKNWFSSPSELTVKDHSSKLPEIKKALHRVNRLMKWSNSCLIMSLSAKKMLNKRKIASQLHLGLQLNPQKKLVAHAWIEVQHTELVEKDGKYTVLFTI